MNILVIQILLLPIMFWHFRSFAKSKHYDAYNCNDISWRIMCANRWCYIYFWKANLTFREHLFRKWYDDDFSCFTFVIMNVEWFGNNLSLMAHKATFSNKMHFLYFVSFEFEKWILVYDCVMQITLHLYSCIQLLTTKYIKGRNERYNFNFAWRKRLTFNWNVWKYIKYLFQRQSS